MPSGFTLDAQRFIELIKFNSVNCIYVVSVPTLGSAAFSKVLKKNARLRMCIFPDLFIYLFIIKIKHDNNKYCTPKDLFSFRRGENVSLTKL